MKKSFENCGFLVISLALLSQLFLISNGNFITKIMGFGVGIIFTISLMVIFGMIDLTRNKYTEK